MTGSNRGRVAAMLICTTLLLVLLENVHAQIDCAAAEDPHFPICCPSVWPENPQYVAALVNDSTCDEINNFAPCYDGGDCCSATRVHHDIPGSGSTRKRDHNGNIFYSAVDIKSFELSCKQYRFTCDDTTHPLFGMVANGQCDSGRDLTTLSYTNLQAEYDNVLGPGIRGNLNWAPCFDGGDCCIRSCSVLSQVGYIVDGAQQFRYATCAANLVGPSSPMHCVDPRFQDERDRSCAAGTPGVLAPWWVGDGICNAENNVAPCFDGGDCCASSCNNDAGKLNYNERFCGSSFDASQGDVTPVAPAIPLYLQCIDPAHQPANGTGNNCDAAAFPERLADGICDLQNNVEGCWDLGDCCPTTSSGSGPYCCQDPEQSQLFPDPGALCTTRTIPAECIFAPMPTLAGDGRCDIANLEPPCFDGGDCCPQSCQDDTFTCGSEPVQCPSNPRELTHSHPRSCENFQAYRCQDPRYYTFDCSNAPAPHLLDNGVCDAENNDAPCFDNGACCPETCYHLNGGDCSFVNNLEATCRDPNFRRDIGKFCVADGYEPTWIGDGYCDIENAFFGCGDLGDCCENECFAFPGALFEYECGANGYRCQNLLYVNDSFTLPPPTAAPDPNATVLPCQFTNANNSFTYDCCGPQFDQLTIRNGVCDVENNYAPCWDGGSCCDSGAEPAPVEPVQCAGHDCFDDGALYQCKNPVFRLREYDCSALNASSAHLLGNGFCDEQNNVAPCFDAGDCCATTCTHSHGFVIGGICDEKLCLDPVYNPIPQCKSIGVLQPIWLNDRYCDQDNAVPGCHDANDCCIETCGQLPLEEETAYRCGEPLENAATPGIYDYSFSCQNPTFRRQPLGCNIEPPVHKIGDGVCDTFYNYEGCWDGGDCCASTCDSPVPNDDTQVSRRRDHETLISRPFLACGPVYDECLDPNATDSRVAVPLHPLNVSFADARFRMFADGQWSIPDRIQNQSLGASLMFSVSLQQFQSVTLEIDVFPVHAVVDVFTEQGTVPTFLGDRHKRFSGRTVVSIESCTTDTHYIRLLAEDRSLDAHATVTVLSQTHSDPHVCPCYLPAYARDENNIEFTVFSGREARRCYDAIQSNVLMQGDMVQRLQSSMSLYAFTDIARNSGSPLLVESDLVLGLSRIASNIPYKADVDFHFAVQDLFATAGDAGLQYHLPEPYAHVMRVRPFLFSMRDGLVYVREHRLLGESWQHWTGVSLDHIPVDRHLLSVDGVPATQWLVSLFPHSFQHQGNALNYALQHAHRHPMRGAQDTHEVFFFSHGVTLSSPTMYISTDLFRQPADVSAALPRKPPAKKRSDQQQPLQPVNGKLVSQRKRIHYKSTHRDRRKSADMEHVISFANNFQCYVNHDPLKSRPTMTLQNNTNGTATAPVDAMVLRMPWMRSPLMEAAHPMSQQWDEDAIAVVQDCVRLAPVKGATELILDVRGNQNGDSEASWCLARHIAQVLVPEWRPRGAFPFAALLQHDVRIEEVLETHAGGNWSQLPASRYMQDSSVQTRGGGTSAYSARFTHPTCEQFQAVHRPITDAIAPTFQHVLILTDGLCNHACAALITLLRNYGHAAIVSQGGQLLSPTLPDIAVYSSCPGSSLSYTHDVVPGINLPAIPYSSDVTFTFKEVYMGNNDVPMQFELYKPDFRIASWDFTNASAAFYRQLFQTFTVDWSVAVPAQALPVAPVTRAPTPAQVVVARPVVAAALPGDYIDTFVGHWRSHCFNTSSGSTSRFELQVTPVNFTLITQFGCNAVGSGATAAPTDEGEVGDQDEERLSGYFHFSGNLRVLGSSSVAGATVLQLDYRRKLAYALNRVQSLRWNNLNCFERQIYSPFATRIEDSTCESLGLASIQKCPSEYEIWTLENDKLVIGVDEAYICTRPHKEQFPLTLTRVTGSQSASTSLRPFNALMMFFIISAVLSVMYFP